MLPFICVCIFAVCALLITSGGVRVYYSAVKNEEQVFSARTGLSYITMKLRQAETAGSIEVNGGRIIIGEEIGGTAYETHIYLEEGMLRESFVKKGADAAGGTALVPAEKFSIEEKNGGLIAFTLTDADGNEESASVFVHASTEG